ncbi:MAG: tRNA uridine-5-carboxymethylaminomethyl(34) synthesis GTPase MnmE [Ruminococcaceae bacterium]|nr:tRNA uridine-5-carboxymethylaminomethyl(34) synthesis GTPase MnmE [Oscillospiraceae bacterium]
MHDTIAAIATARAPSAIGILRLTGPETVSVLDRVFRPKGRPMSARNDRVMVLGDVLDKSGRSVDSGLAVLFRGPNSYTGEDCAEIHCHGSPVVLQEVLLSLFAAGARQAKGGEFTQRAFLNGRMDLIQAESVVDLIDAETAEAARHAVAQLSGALSRGVEEIYDALMDITSRFYAVVDYPDEDIEELQRETMVATLASAEGKLKDLLATFDRGRILKQGLPAVILGKPNAGKSSLLNALLGYDRAIVTDVAGTTRDTVEEKVPLGRVLLRLCDTAGIRQSGDVVEQLGVERSRRAAQNAQLALLVIDASRPLSGEDEEAMALAESVPQVVVALNKTDLPCAVDEAALCSRFARVVSVCAKTGEGLAQLTETIEALYPLGDVPRGELLTNARQADAVGRALQSVSAAREALDLGMTPDVVLTDAEAALEALGELNGKSIREDLVATIFSRFCVGK